jgi:hypothetical protein
MIGQKYFLHNDFYRLDLALENQNDKSHYGIYANGKFLVESYSIANMNNITNY